VQVPSNAKHAWRNISSESAVQLITTTVTVRTVDIAVPSVNQKKRIVSPNGNLRHLM
jgi:hypothetical protein